MENVVLGTRTLKLTRSERHALCHSVLEQFPRAKESCRKAGWRPPRRQSADDCYRPGSYFAPRVSLFDEPSAELAPAVVSEAFE